MMIIFPMLIASLQAAAEAQLTDDRV